MKPLETVKLRVLTHEKPLLDLREVGEVVRDLVQPNSHIYWLDLSASVLLGWLSFGLFLYSANVYLQTCAFIGAVILLYRALFFIHEITHHSSKSLPGFNFAWNVFVVMPMMVPSFLYETVHLDHHRRHKYGTLADPEYLPLGRGSRLDVLIFLGKTVLFPVALAVRALILVPLGLMVWPFHKWLEVNLSALVINESYKRDELTEFERSRMKMIELMMLIFWSGVVVLYFDGSLPHDFFVKWYLLIVTVGLVNQIRTLVAHRYNNEGREMEYEEQLLDSVNVEGGWLTELWAPVGARYHALHHYVPRLPYHSLPEAHRRIKIRFADNPVYSKVNEESFLSTIKKLWKVVVLAILVMGVVQTPQYTQASQSDPCVARIKNSIEKRENSSLVRAGLKNIDLFKEVGAPVPFGKNKVENLFGRFFQIAQNNKKILFWMIPYANGKACILREVRKL